MQRLRIETDPNEVLSYIRDFDYPNKTWLKEPWMMEYSLSGRVLDGDETVAFIWGHWVDDGILTAHVGTMPGAKIDWVNLLDDLMTVSDFLGADEIGLSFDGVHRAKALGRLVKTLGFTHDPENPYNINNFYRKHTHG